MTNREEPGMTIEPMESVVMRVDEAARILGIGRQTAYNLAAQGKLPGARRLGRRIVVSRKALEAFLSGTQE